MELKSQNTKSKPIIRATNFFLILNLIIDYNLILENMKHKRKFENFVE